MRALVLGGAGFIGVHLTRRLLAEGHEVTVVDDFSRGRNDPDLAALDVPVISADLTDPESFDRLPHGWDQVYLLAAVVGVRNVEKDPGRVVHVNTMVVLNTLDWIKPEEKLFFASTSEVYAGGVSAGIVQVPTPETVPVMIDDVTAPRFAYAASKLLGEEAVVHMGRARGLSFVIGRFHNVYGPRMGADHVIPELSLRAARREDPFKVYGTDQYRAFCYVDDAVSAMLLSMDKVTGEIVHIGNDEETNIGDLTKLVLRIADHDPVLDVESAPAGSVARRCPDLTKLRALTGYEPAVPLEEGVRRTFEWYRGNA
ncbi:NAD-dependent epimerase/dehydratase family protein [Kibdelosporangium phytohabitans]|uniref:Epimerase n=1 Tax=Kibdelosporangium phytohabitans TaxID=860235 RepID=A0A0N9HV04_9PSEU|nr:NAD-dependent epimerase/dehydratase family protein [Kibdelosporangium phytohabitans]ALG06742.1 epimerase [Kibdelosporangium phytohabitans]MBE1467968.1 UDP-glucose 4-epimerase/UDP-glucuronate decarboxylase [Kibdelosporangium phytohabitans]